MDVTSSSFLLSVFKTLLYDLQSLFHVWFLSARGGSSSESPIGSFSPVSSSICCFKSCKTCIWANFWGERRSQYMPTKIPKHIMDLHQPLTNTFDELQKNQHTIVSARNLVVFEFWCQCKLLELECKLHPQAHHEPAILMPECHWPAVCHELNKRLKENIINYNNGSTDLISKTRKFDALLVVITSVESSMAPMYLNIAYSNSANPYMVNFSMDNTQLNDDFTLIVSNYISRVSRINK